MSTAVHLEPSAFRCFANGNALSLRGNIEWKRRSTHSKTADFSKILVGDGPPAEVRWRQTGRVKHFSNPKFDGLPWLIDDPKARLRPASEQLPKHFGDLTQWVRSNEHSATDPNEKLSLGIISKNSLVGDTIAAVCAQQGYGGAHGDRNEVRAHAAIVDAFFMDEIFRAYYNRPGVRARRERLIERPRTSSYVNYPDNITKAVQSQMSAAERNKWEGILSRHFDVLSFIDEATARSAEFGEWLAEAETYRDEKNPDFTHWHNTLWREYAFILHPDAQEDRAAPILRSGNLKLQFVGPALLQKPRKHKPEIIDGLKCRGEKKSRDGIRIFDSSYTRDGVVFDSNGNEADNDPPETQFVQGDARPTQRSVEEQRRLVDLRHKNRLAYALEFINGSTERMAEMEHKKSDTFRDQIDNVSKSAGEFDYDNAPSMVKIYIAAFGGLWVQTPPRPGKASEYLHLYDGPLTGADRATAVERARRAFLDVAVVGPIESASAVVRAEQARGRAQSRRTAKEPLAFPKMFDVANFKFRDFGIPDPAIAAENRGWLEAYKRRLSSALQNLPPAAPLEVDGQSEKAS